MTLALYSDLLMVCVLFAHAVYVIARHRNLRSLRVFAFAACASLLAFSPWAVICVRQRHQIAVETGWALSLYPPKLMLEKWLFNTGTVLFDAEYANMLLAPLAGLLLLVLAYAVFRFLRDENASTRWFVIALGGVIALQQILTDVITHGHESTTARYLAPLWVALLVVLALFFGRGIAGGFRGGWIFAFCAVLALAGFSNAINSAAVAWWDNNDNYPSTTIAQRINDTSAPLVLSEGHWTEVLVLSHYLEPQTRFVLFKSKPPSAWPPAANTFLLAPSTRTLDALASRPRLDLVQVPIRPLASDAMLSFHDALRKAQADVPGAQRLRWQNNFLFRLESRVATR
ncbi:MAG: hypothetical protein JO029_15080 [Candidatus Eremiobacteraeota bacterium]|nr:hypothetical protein [Candidatus Eremiobacteraeota bacterium]